MDHFEAIAQDAIVEVSHIQARVKVRVDEIGPRNRFRWYWVFLRPPFLFEQAQQLLLAVHAELVVNVADVGGDGAFGERQLLADERGGAPAGEIAEDLRLPLGESVALRGLGRDGCVGGSWRSVGARFLLAADRALA